MIETCSGIPGLLVNHPSAIVFGYKMRRGEDTFNLAPDARAQFVSINDKDGVFDAGRAGVEYTYAISHGPPRVGVHRLH
jgi:hypothetical protein